MHRARDTLSTIPLVIDSACRSLSPQPISLGVPFPRGVLVDADALCLSNSEGRVLALQKQVLARWSDQSAKWVLLDFMLPEVSQGKSTCTLGISPTDSPDREYSGICIRESSGSLVVETGTATFHLDRHGMRPFARVVIQDRDVLETQQSQIELTHPDGSASRARIERMVVETQGPVRTVVRSEGTFAGRVLLTFRARIAFFMGTGLVRFELTIRNPRRAHHRGGLWDLGDRGAILFRELAIQLNLSVRASYMAWSAEIGQSRRSVENGPVEIYQDSSGGDNWQSKNHVNREGRVPCSFRGYRQRVGNDGSYGLRANPTLTLTSANGTIGVAVPEFWQQFPKALETDGSKLRVGLFPRQFGDVFELQGGEQKTHVVWFDFAAVQEHDSLDWVHQPARVHSSPEWNVVSEVSPHLTRVSHGSQTRLNSLLQDAIAVETGLRARSETIDEFGWRNYGDLHADHEAAYYRGPLPIISHYNNQYDVVQGALVRYLRTGERCWFEIFDPLARHVIDIDIYHTNRDKAAYNGGLFWHTDHYCDAGFSTHRAYSRVNKPNSGPYGGGLCNEHNYTTGLLHYHYLTGDPNAREAVLSLADWVIDMDDGKKTILRLLDDGPTGLASRTFEADYHGPGRGCGNSINALLDAWLLTNRRFYLDKAEELVRRSIHPHDDVSQRNLLHVESRWSYTVFLSVLSRYLGIKAEAGELDSMYAYARASLLHYAAWMLENERPYFDRPEELEFPTETWAAQELRKANVLRLAGLHADEPLRSRLFRRGEDLAERAWSDLLRFESRATTRSIALLMIEGSLDECIWTSRAPELRPLQEYDFGQPEPFVPQRIRVRNLLRNPLDLVKALVKILDTRRSAGPRAADPLDGSRIDSEDRASVRPATVSRSFSTSEHTRP